MIHLVLVDDHDVVREGLQTLLNAQPDICVVGDAADGAIALHLVEQLHPDVLLVDLKLKLDGISGLEVARRTRAISPHTQVVVLSMLTSVAYVAEAMRVGVVGYVGKGAGIVELLAAVRAAAQGKHYLDSQLDHDALDRYLDLTDGLQPDPYEELTIRERDVLALVAQGRTSAEIAAMWVVSRRTVESHRSNMMRKLGLTSQADVIRFAVRRGILVIEE